MSVYPMKQRSPWGVWLLAIVTLAIYFYVWYYKIHRELLDRFPHHQINPDGSLLTMLFGWVVIVPPLVSVANTGGRVAKAEYEPGVRVTASGGVGVLLWLLAGLACRTTDEDQHCDRRGPTGGSGRAESEARGASVES